VSEHDEIELREIVSFEQLVAMQDAAEEIFVSDSVSRYIGEVVAATRTSARIEVGASPRGSLALYKLSRCHAAHAGRDFVLPDDVNALARCSVNHTHLTGGLPW
jgi:MoxR-like ATPase